MPAAGEPTPRTDADPAAGPAASPGGGPQSAGAAQANPKPWGGRFTAATDRAVEAFTASIDVDRRLLEVDIRASQAHARMLGACGVLPPEEARTLVEGLEEVRRRLQSGEFELDPALEDVHMNVEHLLGRVVGPLAGKLHTGRSRNDQVATDMHLYMKEALGRLIAAVRDLQRALVEKAEAHLDVIMPGYTHLQRAQPVLFAHHLLAYFWMLERDAGRLADARRRTGWCPLGAAALAGTGFPLDRERVARELGFARVYPNSMDAVSDRDYLLEFLAAGSILAMHLSRLCEELVLWSSEEFGFIELADTYCTGSSIMPQKKNPDVAELVRSKTGRVYGALFSLLTVMKGLPLTYNRDLQEDKPGVFDALDTLEAALPLCAGMIRTMRVRADRMEAALERDFSAATDLADYLVERGVPFREAHRIVGELVLHCIRAGRRLQDLTLDDLRSHSPLFGPEALGRLSPRAVVEARKLYGGTARQAVERQLAEARAILAAAAEQAAGDGFTRPGSPGQGLAGGGSPGEGSPGAVAGGQASPAP
ncbi:argininosuccinate lyase [Thermaerobacter sp. FW80]|uniref:argininosuccinate lyase n=1 Tax=Thermaerobacter sp. FW80 TaxID=2546351 RepID=UPI0010754BB9|nr:argininosuccinate lyase [Thermaerobacter sp. FW80]QBS37488.1 argininosuccinate lyase [Thermaerobacter sp. FW80]